MRQKNRRASRMPRLEWLDADGSAPIRERRTSRHSDRGHCLAGGPAPRCEISRRNLPGTTAIESGGKTNEIGFPHYLLANVSSDFASSSYPRLGSPCAG